MLVVVIGENCIMRPDRGVCCKNITGDDDVLKAISKELSAYILPIQGRKHTARPPFGNELDRHQSPRQSYPSDSRDGLHGQAA